MRILFDHNAPVPLIPFLSPHTVTTARQAGWERLTDGLLLDAAERGGFSILLTADQRIVTQQNPAGRQLALVVLGSSNWKVVQRYTRRIAQAVDAAEPGTYTHVPIPFRQCPHSAHGNLIESHE
jgi:predicted nuclease of predicted toxin-antitoxin system